jgi:uncharacterized membrane protein YphA (DoxX/SURF4 family)
MEPIAIKLSQARIASNANLPRILARMIDRNAVTALRVSIGVIFLWFGVLKFFPSLSPAEPLASETLAILTLGIVPSRIALLFLAAFECGIGLCFVTGTFARYALPLLCCHMLGTALPFLFFPTQLFVRFPFVPSFEGQYIMKNLIIVSAALTIRGPWLRRTAARRSQRARAAVLAGAGTVDPA